MPEKFAKQEFLLKSVKILWMEYDLLIAQLSFHYFLKKKYNFIAKKGLQMNH